MVVAFRVDVGHHIGTGHVKRCLTLAKKLRNHNFKCIFFVRYYGSDQWFGNITNDGFDYCVISYSDEIVKTHHENWLGISQEQDANDFIRAVSKQQISLVIVDHYSISSEWESIVKKHTSLPIMLIDDLANRQHDCDILLDQNFVSNFQSRYENLVSTTTIQLLGPEYTLLRDRFRELRKSSKLKKNLIMVNFGGIGDMRIWNIFLPAFIKNTKYNFHLITGKLNKDDFNRIQQLVKDCDHIKVDETVDNISEIMSSSTFSIGACGSTVWERFCLGLNSCLIDIAENQTEIVQFLYHENLVDYLGSIDQLNMDEVVKYLDNLNINTPKYDIRNSKIIQLVDGLGAERVANIIVNYLTEK